MSNKQLNLKGIAFYSIIAVILVLVIIYFLPINPNPIKSLINGLAASLNLNLGSSDLAKQITSVINDNKATIAGVGVTAIPLGYAYVKSYMSKKKAEAELQAQQEISQLSTQEASLKIKSLEDKLKVYETDNTASELNAKILGLNDDKDKLTNTIGKLEGQIQSLQRQGPQLVESLWAKSGGQTIEVDGIKYRLIEKQIVEVK